MYSCQEATELIERRAVVPLSLEQRIKLRAHISMCSACQSYERQSLLMEKIIQRLINSPESKEKPIKMKDTTKAKILEKLKNPK